MRRQQTTRVNPKATDASGLSGLPGAASGAGPGARQALQVKTQKARRRAAAAAANDPAVFQRTAYGRRRIRSFPARLALGVAVLLAFPFVFWYRALRRSKRTDWR